MSAEKTLQDHILRQCPRCGAEGGEVLPNAVKGRASCGNCGHIWRVRETEARCGDDGRSPGLDNTRILVVDDDPVNRALVVVALRRLGVTIDVAADGAEAVAAFRTRQYDFIVTDCFMPHMNGYDAVARMRALEPIWQRVPILVMTSSTDASVHQKCRAAGADLVVNKSVGAHHIRKVVWTYLSGERGAESPWFQPRAARAGGGR